MTEKTIKLNEAATFFLFKSPPKNLMKSVGRMRALPDSRIERRRIAREFADTGKMIFDEYGMGASRGRYKICWAEEARAAALEYCNYGFNVDLMAFEDESGVVAVCRDRKILSFRDFLAKVPAVAGVGIDWKNCQEIQLD